MSSRSRGREYAMQILYQMDVQGKNYSVENLQVATIEYWSSFNCNVQTRNFAESLVGGVGKHIENIHETLKSISSHWKIERMSPVDRCILCLGVYELKFCDTPPAVVINEAIELGKKFGAKQSSAFINGILDKVKIGRNISKP